MMMPPIPGGKLSSGMKAQEQQQVLPVANGFHVSPAKSTLSPKQPREVGEHYSRSVWEGSNVAAKPARSRGGGVLAPSPCDLGQAAGRSGTKLVKRSRRKALEATAQSR